MSKLKLDAIGHIGRDCSIKHLDSGTTAINFSIACTEKYKDRTGQQHEKTTWVDCVVWRKPDNLKVAEYLRKGQLISVEGRPDVRAYSSKTGIACGVLQLRVDKLILLGKSTQTEQNTTPAAEEAAGEKLDDANAVFAAATQEDDLPF